MKLLTVPAWRGMQWLRGGFRVFLRQPLAYTALFMAFLFGLMVLLSLPSIGALVGLILVPAANVGFVLASETAEAGRTPSPALLVVALRGPRARVIAMIQIGIAYALAALLAKWLADLIDPGFDERLAAFMEPASDPANLALPVDDLQWGLLLRLLLPVPLTLVFWHAPVIVYRSGIGAAKAVFASAVACWRNLGAFAVYGLSWVILLTVFAVFTLGFFAMLGQPRFAVLVTVPAALMFSTAFYASLYFSVVDCFDFDPDTEPA